MAGPRRGGGGSYNRIDQPNGVSSEHSLDEPLDPGAGGGDGGDDAAPANAGDRRSGSGGASAASRSCGLTPPEESEGGIVVVVLDTRQKKFRVNASPDWTVSEFKRYSATVHRVPANSQRLIYMGKLLADDRTLREQNLVVSEKIVHLFPKPNVVLASAGGNGASEHKTDDDEGDEGGRSDGGDDEDDVVGHIPQIVVDPEHHSQMIVTTNELFEAQHRVKLLSFLLLIICSMELLTLMTIFLGPDEPAGEQPPGDPTDYQPQNAEEVQMREWRGSDYFDVVLSSCGFYVSLLGLRASTENTLDGAKKYFLGLVGVGIAWLGYYYYLSLDQVRRAQESAAGVDCNDDAAAADGGGGGDGDPCGGSDSGSGGGGETVQSDPYGIYTQAAFGLALPVIVWLMCFLRAWQFRVLIREAEREAEERHLEQTEQLRQAAGGGAGAGAGGGDDDSPPAAGGGPSARLVQRGYDDEDLGGDLRLTQSVVIV